MLTIKRELRSHLGEPAFEDRTILHFQIMRPGMAYRITEHELRRRVRHGLAKGRSYGLTWEYSLTLFLAHMLVINPRFDEHPAMQAVLRDASIPPDERVDLLTSDRVSSEQWEEAQAIGDPAEYWAMVAREGEKPVGQA
jgi:hypothetical protein